MNVLTVHRWDEHSLGAQIDGKRRCVGFALYLPDMG